VVDGASGDEAGDLDVARRLGLELREVVFVEHDEGAAPGVEPLAQLGAGDGLAVLGVDEALLDAGLVLVVEEVEADGALDDASVELDRQPLSAEGEIRLPHRPRAHAERESKIVAGAGETAAVIRRDPQPIRRCA
jgi:hypothetical protein